MAKKKTTSKKTTTKNTTEEKTTKGKEKPPESLVEKKQTVYKKMRVNMWRTRLHGEELGIYQSLKYRAKTRLYAKDFDTEGVVEIDGEKKWIVAYNKEKWQNRTKDNARLLLRLFTILEEKMGVGTGGNFVGGIELSITHSLIQSYEIKHAAPVFFVQLPRSPDLIKIVRGWRLQGTRWSWPLLPEKKEDKLQMVKARGTVGLGRDYDIFLGDVKIARVDNQRMTKDTEIEIFDENLAKDSHFVAILALFGTLVFFMKDVEEIIEHNYKGMKETGTTDYKVPRHEAILFRNPRFMTRK
ncbi:MAG: hypothetical protein JW891_09255 [Candidatus Lokiarchaeota archaeon]|nr:hypothetical protein [Candidatus Lokiarchaeota archaeon]